MTENLLPGIELANGDCAAVLPKLPPADLIPPRRPMTVCGNMADTTMPLTLTRLPRLVSSTLRRVGCWSGWLPAKFINGGESGTSFRQTLGYMGLGLTMYQVLILEKWSLAGMRPKAYFRTLSWTNPGDLVIDPLVGRGTTLRAAAYLGRRAIGIEINPEYGQLIRRRLAQSVPPVER